MLDLCNLISDEDKKPPEDVLKFTPEEEEIISGWEKWEEEYKESEVV
jgi:hypothetical protein